MSNFAQTRDEVKNYILACVPLVIIDTPERERAEKLLREIAAELNLDISYYTDARQVRSFGRNNAHKDVNKDPLPYVAEEFMHKKHAVFALGDCRRIGEDSSYTRELLNIVYLAREASSTLIIITPDLIWSRLAQSGMLVRLDKPDLNERKLLIQSFVRMYSGRYPINWSDGEIDRAATLLRGFSEMQINNILSSALMEHKGLSRENIPELAGQKSRLYASIPSIQEVAVKPSLNVSGLEHLKDWLRQKQKIFFAPDEQLQQWNLASPRGILLVGVPGCGKSLSAKMVSMEWDLPLFRFDLGTVYDKWVGESEKRMKDALEFLDNVSPCVVWVDEIEKALAVSDGGNDVGRRVLGQFLFWLQESDSRIFLVATANDISALPTELFRKGRFSEIFFIDLPDEEERASAISYYCRSSLHWEPSYEDLRQLVAASNDFTYADIEYSVKSLAEEKILDALTPVDARALSLRFNQIVPYAKTNPETLDRLRKWGSERAVNASVL